MEILGFVWVASIINQPSVLQSERGTSGGELQQHVAARGPVSWFSSLAQAYGWADAGSAVGVFSSYASSTSWLLPNLGDSGFNRWDAEAEDIPFLPMLPLIADQLTSLEAQVDSSLAEGESYTVLGDAERWERWDAVAAVRLVELDQGGHDASTEPFSQQCMPTAMVPYQESPIALTAAPKQQIWVHDQFIGEVAGKVKANAIAGKLRDLIQKGVLDPQQVKPLFGSNFVAVSHGGDVLFVVDETLQAHPEMPAAAVAVQWVNNLRAAFDAPLLELVQVQMAMAGLTQTSENFYGTASWYGPGFHGRTTANGERFDENALTAAHKKLPFNTYLKVTNRMNGKSVVVRINDRGPYIGNRTIDLSKAAARCLGSIGKGVIPYEAVILEPVPQPDLQDVTLAQVIPE